MSTSVRRILGWFLVLLLNFPMAEGATVGEETVYFDPLPVSLERSDTIGLPLPDYDRISIQARVCLPRFRPAAGVSKEAWTLGFASEDRSADLTVTLRYIFADFDSPSPNVLVEIHSGGKKIEELSTTSFSKDPKAYNTIVAEIDRRQCLITFRGNGEIDELASVRIEDFPDEAFVTATCRAEMAMFVARAQVTPSKILMSGFTDETLAEAIASQTDPLVGIWTYLDRTNHPDYSRPGGKYTLAVVADGDNFDIVYLGGAEINSSQWPRFTLKGRLAPSTVPGSYALTWYDAEFNELSEECFATLSPDGRVLSLEFPLLQSSLRFEKSRAI